RQQTVRLQGTADWAELWHNVIASAKYLNLVKVQLDVNVPLLHEGYHARWGNSNKAAEGQTDWRAEIPLMVGQQVLGRLQVIGLHDHEPFGEKMGTLLELVEYFEAAACDLVRDKSAQREPKLLDACGHLG